MSNSASGGNGSGKNRENGSSNSGGKGGLGNGFGGDDSNSGSHGKTNDVKDISKVSTHVGESGMVFSAGETKGTPDTRSSATVPYTQVMSSYSKAAENALSKEKVPPAYRKRVKEYFHSLE